MPVEWVTGIALATKVIRLLLEWKTASDNNKAVRDEVELFVKSLNENVAHLQEMLPREGSAWALESLQNDLNELMIFLEGCLNKGFIRKTWEVKTIAKELSQRRQRLADAFQTKMFITMLEIAVEGDKKMDNFQSKMLQVSAHNSATQKSEIRSLLQTVVGGIQRQDEKIQSFISTFQGTETGYKLESSGQTDSKFLADVLANLEELTQETITRAPDKDPDHEFYDPITFELMCDPVKCSDGHTYDRWTVIRNNFFDVQPLKIVCDDVDVRGRLFEKFPREGLDVKYRRLRQEYRKEALTLAQQGHDGEALTRLKHVLEWNESDTECRQMCAQIMRRSNSTGNFNGGMQAPVGQQFGYPMKEDTNLANSSVNKFNFSNPVMQAPAGQQFGYPMKEDTNLANSSVNKFDFSDPGVIARLCVLIMCFPFSICCLPCLLPELSKDTKPKGSYLQ